MIATAEIGRFKLLQFFRSLVGVLVVIFLARTVELETHTALLALSALFGTYLAGRLLMRGGLLVRILAVHALLFVLVAVGFFAANYAFVTPSGPAGGEFFIARLQDQIYLLLMFYFVSFLTTWFFWTRAHYVTFEAMFCGAVFVWILGSHRNYHLDAPKEISALAWNLSVAPQHVLLGMGVLFTLLVSVYLLLSTTRPLFSGVQVVATEGRKRRIAGLITSSMLFMLLAGYAVFVNRHYSSNLSRATEGVGQGGKEGESPLGFHSAIGKTKQPAALVRLEGDYASNPWSPMLYLREGALSEFNGRELVNAGSGFDQDVVRSKPGTPFIGLESDPGPNREKLVQSVYLLASHSAPFAVDFPRSIRLIKNPDPERFEVAYQALSYAPKIKLENLIGENVGSPSWDAASLAHYLRAPGSTSVKSVGELGTNLEDPLPDERGEDLRYSALARMLTKDAEAPVAKAASIVSALSQTSIYTRKPGHQIAKDGDPVAPYLFSKDRRGYCVHFAHAAVYLMRLAGIPARIATGYLTDLSYAKDGHILLHLGDRHAWPEIYVAGQGWVVADVQPAQAENEQAIVPDEKLLEELMSKIDPAQELVAPQDLEDELPKQESVLDKLLNRGVIITTAVLIVASLILAKIWLLISYRLPAGPRIRALRAYRACMTRMMDLNLFREFGETHLEYAGRVRKSAGLELSQVSSLFERSRYARTFEADAESIAEGVRSFTSSLKARVPLWKRLISAVNPLCFLRLNRW